ncbi:hypothetical protein Tco_1491595 [Tanacetum coccineum]
MDSILEDSVDKDSFDDNLVDTISEMFTDEHDLDYSSPPIWDDYDENFLILNLISFLPPSVAQFSMWIFLRLMLCLRPTTRTRIARIFEASRARCFFLRSQELQILSFILGIQYPNLID